MLMSGLDRAAEGPLPEFIERLGHADRLERVHAAADLVRLGRQRDARAVVAAVVAALADNRAVVRKMAALVLGDLAVEAATAVGALAAALRDPDEGVRRRAAVALGQFRTEARPALAALHAALSDEDDGVRSFAATSLSQIAPASGVPEEAA
jgi:HEAT repeat protein